MTTKATPGKHARLGIDAMGSWEICNFVLRDKFRELLDSRFIYYYFFTLGLKAEKLSYEGIIPGFHIYKVKRLPFPIPPLEMQREIVNILNKFRPLKYNSEARQKQYEYYRNKLLLLPGVKRQRLGSVCQFISGKGLNKDDITNTGKRCIHSGDLLNCCTEIIPTKKTTRRIEESVLSREGDVLILKSTFKRELMPSVGCLMENNIIIGHSILICRSDVLNPKYLTHYIKNNQNQIRQTISGTRIFNFYKSSAEKLIIPVPPKPVQDKIVSILDKINYPTRDSWELEAREKQLKYYRYFMMEALHDK